ncbi:Cna B-type domain-containing protein [Listeria fleischmannii]|uniref:Cna B-type domain-containing protein n=1 Tax=Listeria fleischmannii TaxID=1069827 RepID=A0A841YBN6_9LIST|nr:Cna B-type domain-containing protein [Listeria fleischmannii]MBC1397666.1 Cna B-type domain-containing protein [Listeria fleischmannii]MBC1426793.1 Cna B-type domain-containing protein [Listeria fleischmannii]
MKKIANIIVVSLLFLGLIWNSAASNHVVEAKEGDDPGVTIDAPEILTSRQQAEIKVTLSASAGKLEQDGKIEIKIPQNTVSQVADLTNNLMLGDPFYLPEPAVTEDGAGNYVLHVAYDHSKINPVEATGQTFTIKYGAAVFKDNAPTSAAYEATLYKAGVKISEATDNSRIEKVTSGLPLLSKMSTRPHKDINGENVAMMSTSTPSANVFAIIVNYNQQQIPNAVLEDNIPAQTTLTDPIKYISATGDNTPEKHIRIAEVTERDAAGLPIGWKYVTSQFTDKITTSSAGFKINFGTITPDKSYVVMYAQKIADNVTPSDFGIKYNQAILKSNGATLRTASEALGLDSLSYESVGLIKKVSQATISTTGGSFVYSLDLNSKVGTIPAGTEIVDPLPDYTTFSNTVLPLDEYFSDGVYDSATNTVTYTLLKDLTEGEQKTIHFKVNYHNKTAKEGYKITNRAYINYAGTKIYSNDATTTVEGSAILKKMDNLTQKPLTGALFNVVDTNGNIVKANLSSDADGEIHTGLLEPGDYQFIEVKAPAGYILDATPISFKVKPSAEHTIQLNKTNAEGVLISGTKTWQDDSDKAQKRPDSITIWLYQNGKKLMSKKVSKSDDWKYTFSSLKKYDSDGKAYVYTLKEDPVEGYETVQSGYDFTNVYKAQETVQAGGVKEDPKSPSQSDTINSSQTKDPKIEDPKAEAKKVLPRAGDDFQNDSLFVLAGAVLLAVAIFMYQSRKKQSK